MKKTSFKILTLIVITVLSFQVGAEPVDIDQALNVAASQVALMNNRDPLSNNLELKTEVPYKSSLTISDGKGNSLGYVFNLEPTGFVVVTANTDLVPVMAYSHQGFFQLNESNVLLDILLKDIANRLDAIELMSESSIEDNHQKWEQMSSGDIEALGPGDSWPPVGRTFTGGWIETAWTQTSPFNDKCPIDPITEVRCLAGCPAIAMAQIINFWQYPDSVIFQPSDSYTSSYQGRIIEIDAPAASIPTIDYNYGEPTDEMAASLCYACGVATESVFSSVTSGVFTNSWCAHGFTEHFDYTSADFREGDGGDFYAVMEQNIKDSMPAIIVIVGEIGGHTLVCDGFREPVGGGDNEWHLNFGWGASQPDPLFQAWYVIPEGLPMGLTTLHEAIVNIEAPRRPIPAALEEQKNLEGGILISQISIGSTTINYTLQNSTMVNLCIYDASGRLIRLLSDGVQGDGSYSVTWDNRDDTGASVPSGLYFCRFSAGNQTSSQKILLAR